MAWNPTPDEQLEADWRARFSTSRPAHVMMEEMTDFYNIAKWEGLQKYNELTRKYRLEEQVYATYLQLLPIFKGKMTYYQLKEKIRDYYRTQMFNEWQKSVLKRII